jgi:hypothetical protein
MYLVPDINYVSLGKRYFKEARSRAMSSRLTRQLADRFRRMRTTSIGDILTERLEIGGESFRGGATVFRESRKHLEILLAEATGFLGRLFLAGSFVVTALLLARGLPGLEGGRVIARLLPTSAAETARLSLLATLILLGALFSLSVGLLVVEQRANELRHDPAEEEKEAV